MSKLRLVLPTAVLLVGFLARPTGTYGNVNYSKQEKKPCITCHVSIKSKELNDVGKCYKRRHSLAGCERKE